MLIQRSGRNFFHWMGRFVLRSTDFRQTIVRRSDATVRIRFWRIIRSKKVRLSINGTHQMPTQPISSEISFHLNSKKDHRARQRAVSSKSQASLAHSRPTLTPLGPFITKARVALTSRRWRKAWPRQAWSPTSCPRKEIWIDSNSSLNGLHSSTEPS